MTVKVCLHPAHGVLGQRTLVDDVARPREADRSHAALGRRLRFADFKSALGGGDHRIIGHVAILGKVDHDARIVQRGIGLRRLGAALRVRCPLRGCVDRIDGTLRNVLAQRRSHGRIGGELLRHHADARFRHVVGLREFADVTRLNRDLLKATESVRAFLGCNLL